MHPTAFAAASLPLHPPDGPRLPMNDPEGEPGPAVYDPQTPPDQNPDIRPDVDEPQDEPNPAPIDLPSRDPAPPLAP
ncbi:MAG TPA: hypothetical protein VLA00_00780 [Xanthobacteraceae bacterium]|nr:hypothetical protein [Xanthobacteraceae bacterium]